MKHTFEIGEKDFLIDGKPTVLRCGEMHYSRIPRPYWRHRLKMLKAMGCNMVATYDFWNLHEPRPGHWNFSGIADLAAYIKMAQEEGLWVMLRPGPYVCAEWELGGIPWWLLKTPDIKLRTQDPRYLAAVSRYVTRLAAEVRSLLVTRGGPILMAQVENEYGSYGKDKEYILAVKKLWQKAGIDVPLFTADGPSQLWNGSRTDTFCGVNGGVDSLNELRRFRPSGPLIITEYYPGWLSHWGEPFPKVGTPGIVRDVTTLLSRGISFNFYVAHGGTSFGLWAGANFPKFAPDTTSYDYNAPIDEAGRATEKYLAIRETIAKATGESLPPVPEPIPTIALRPVRLEHSARLLDHLPKGLPETQPRAMEQYDLGLGAILYRTHLPAGPAGTLTLNGANDWTQVFVGGERVAVLDRRRSEITVNVPARYEARPLDILVEAMGRINYGGGLHDRKGLTGAVLFDGRPLPAFYCATFTVDRLGDTYLDLRNWRKGIVWVNGQNLGRFWDLGPQQTLYCPGCWLKQGKNEVVVLELEEPRNPVLQGLTSPILDGPIRRDPGKKLNLGTLAPNWEGELPDGPELQKLALAEPLMARYVCVESRSNQHGDSFATLAELMVIGAEGKPLPLKLIYADNEETSSENGRADNAVDGNPRTYWHTEYSSGGTDHPHQLVVDLGKVVSVSAVHLLPRQGDGSPNGRFKGTRLYLSQTPFPGLKG